MATEGASCVGSLHGGGGGVHGVRRPLEAAGGVITSRARAGEPAARSAARFVAE